MKKTEQLTYIPDDEVDVVVADFEAIGADVQKKRPSERDLDRHGGDFRKLPEDLRHLKYYR